MNIIFLGPPGAGKGTQAQILSAKMSIPQISTGDMLRAAIGAKTETGLKAKGFMDNGNLVPDVVVIDIVKERLQGADCQKGYILDGFPRTAAQAQALDRFAKIDAVINLDVEDRALVKRLSGRRVCPVCGAPYHVDCLEGDSKCLIDGTDLIQREDDKAETVLNRLRVYHENTAPLIQYYEQAGLLRNICASQTMESVGKEILQTLEAVE